MIKLEIKFITDEDYQLWDKFCYDNLYATFFHTTYAMKYYIDSSFNIDAKQKSFLVIENHSIIACMLVFLEKINDDVNLSYGGNALLNPLIDDKLNKLTKRKVLKFILDELDKLAAENNVKKLEISIGYLNSNYLNMIDKYNYFIEYGFLDKSILTCIVDLKASQDELFKNFTKGHKSAVKKSLKSLTLEIINSENATKQIIYDFMNYYFEVAGKVTRPINTFENIYEWIKKDFGVLFKAIYNDTTCGYSFFSVYKDTAYYSMACKDKTYEQYNISHFLQWQAIKYLQSIGIRYLESGFQDFGDTLFNFPSEKDINISKFKRGFGDFIIPAFKAEKFYSADAFKECYEDRINRYIERNFMKR